MVIMWDFIIEKMSLDLNTVPGEQSFMSRIKWPSLLILDPQGINTWPSVWGNNEEQPASGWMEDNCENEKKKCVENTADNKQLLQNTSYCLLRNVTLSFALSLSVGDECLEVTTLAQAIKVKLQLLRKPIYKTLDLFWKCLFYPESQLKPSWIRTELLMAKKPTSRSLGLPCAVCARVLCQPVCVY